MLYLYSYFDLNYCSSELGWCPNWTSNPVGVKASGVRFALWSVF